MDHVCEKRENCGESPWGRRLCFLTNISQRISNSQLFSGARQASLQAQLSRTESLTHFLVQVRSRLPSEPSIGKQAREIEQRRLEEEYNTFIRKIKVKEKDDGLIG